MSIKNLRYSAKDQAFMASVDIQRFGRVFRYPCTVHGPANMERSALVRQLRHKALQMSDTQV
ncbi:hypothetical protein [Loktanella sp. S4079]|uniref:hypothetical protein n=1 Tax=Loktanella sp. S4079 TaxID=579483 RepID=UPI0005FA26B0|nr:hypothetical protein [Loktanella sp. S4079]KJZ21094.1 hypothetical protein TW80_00045 [Loktanella sp. S4079]